MSTHQRPSSTTAQLAIATAFGPVLERVRKRLLDLSANNTLLNYRHPKASSLRVVDEIPAQIFDRLLGNQPMFFAPLPEPDEATLRTYRLAVSATASDQAGDMAVATMGMDFRARARAERKAAQQRRQGLALRHAAQLGIATEYDLPAAASGQAPRQRDNRLQTLLFPEELAEQLRKIHRVAVTAIEETGANRLHLMLGFVEWSEYKDGNERVSRLAPLVLLPVELRRGDVDRETNTFRYSVAATGEDWSANVTLQEKCRVEFHFDLPDVEAESDETLEHYFARVEAVLQRAQPTWALRRNVTLGLVSFGKILMWRDLDPSKWPASRPIFESEPLRALLGAEGFVDADEAAAGATTNEYRLDTLDDQPDVVPPIVIDADSSQHSALCDVQRGANLVLQGPPGTGKSQTITNLIAGALKANKKVLFVAEKKAALDVVHSRLKKAGLDEFCVALHSHTAAKKEFLADLRRRLDLQGKIPAPAEIRDVQQRAREAREALNGHVERMHRPFGPLGLSPYQVFSRALRRSTSLAPEALDVVRDVRLQQVVHASAQDVERRRDIADDFAGAYDKVREAEAELARHPWAGVTHDDLSFVAVNDLLDRAHAWRGLMGSLAVAVAETEALVGAEVPHTLLVLDALVREVAELPAPHDSVPTDLPHRLVTAAELPAVSAAVAAVEEARARWDEVPGPWAMPGALPRAQAMAAEAVMLSAVDLVTVDSTITHVRAMAAALHSPIQTIATAYKALERIVDALADEPRPDGETLLTGAGAPAFAAIVEATRTVIGRDSSVLDLRSDATANAAIASELQSLAERAAALRATTAQLDAKFPPTFRPGADGMREMATALATAPKFLPWLFSGVYRRAVKTYRAMAAGASPDRATMLADVHTLIAHGEVLASFERELVLHQVFGARAAGVSSPFDAGLLATTWQEQVRTATAPLGEWGRRISRMARAASSAQWREAIERVEEMPDAWPPAVSIGEELRAVAASTGIHAAQWDSQPLMEVHAVLTDVLKRCEAFLRLATAAGVNDEAPIAEVGQRLEAIQAAWAADDQVIAQASVLANLGVTVVGAETNVVPVQGALKYVGHVRGGPLPPAVQRYLLGPDARRALADLCITADRLKEALSLHREAMNAFSSEARLSPPEWLRAISSETPATESVLSNGSLDGTPLERLRQRLDHALQHDKALHPWAIYRRSRSVALAQGLGEIVTLLEAGRLALDSAADAYQAVFFRSLAEAVLRSERDIDTFDSGVHGEVRRRFARLDEELLRLTRQQIAHELSNARIPFGCPGPRVADMSDLALIRHQLGLTRRHAAIREMFRRAGDAIQAMKPCFLMGPQAVAQYLPPGEFEFDLVVMDEASQMRPEDALGAVARGKQVLIVGDPMQLGPTRFFDKQDSSDGDDSVTEELDDAESDVEGSEEQTAEPPPAPITGATVLERSESILLAAAACFPVRMLRWHYRSHHPRLIAFSNREFYNDRLIVFPTPMASDMDDGVFLRRVEGLYSGRRNLPEAQAVVAAVREHSRRFPNRTLLVATLNAEQADLIDGLVEQAEKNDSELVAFRERHAVSQEPFTVKNLENVQGDERDVILVSVTFGPNEAGQVRQNFGPINQAGGERRLNVLFTRAKHRLEVFCSFDPGMLRVVDRSSPRGLRVLRDYLRYANGETWWAAGEESGREPDSDFEIAVAEALSARGYQAKPQIGVAGYFIDLAVVDPDAPDRFLLGVECDGATYHSAKSARDRDRLRQKQLEALGWTLHRIWSTDWFKNSRGETDRLVRHIEELRTRAEERLPTH